MNDESNLPHQRQSSTLKDQIDLLKFLREESEANRKALREDADATRSLFKVISGIVAIPLAVAIGAAGWLWSHDLNTMKQAMRQEGEAAAKVEIQKMDEQIDETLRARFNTETIQNTIKNAAVEATRSEAKPLIETGVRSQVKEAVSEQSGMIQRIATSAVNDKVQETITPLANDVKKSVSALNVHTLVAAANADDAKAYDELLRIEKSGSSNQMGLIKGVIADRARLARNDTTGIIRVDGETLSYSVVPCREPNSPKERTFLHSQDVLTRRGYLQSCTTWAADEIVTRRLPEQTNSALQIEEELIPEIVQIAFTDPSLSVRGAAFSIIDGLLKDSPGFPKDAVGRLDIVSFRSWWNKNEKNYTALHLLSRAKSSKENLDIADLYERLARLRSNSSPDLKADEESALADMREAAKHLQLDRPTLAPKMGRDSCSSVASDFDIRLRDWEGRPDIVDSDNYGTMELEFLKDCPPMANTLPRIVQLSTASTHLSRRYAASMVLNAWLGLKFDPLDSKAIHEWWKQHKGEYKQ